jgi:hypothetical protein
LRMMMRVSMAGCGSQNEFSVDEGGCIPFRESGSASAPRWAFYPPSPR